MVCPPSYKPHGCLQISCLAPCCFTLQIRPCLHLLHTDNGHYGLPWLTTQVTNQNSQGGEFKGEKRGSKNWQGLKRRKKNQHDLHWSQVCVVLSLEKKKTDPKSVTRRTFYVCQKGWEQFPFLFWSLQPAAALPHTNKSYKHKVSPLLLISYSRPATLNNDKYLKQQEKRLLVLLVTVCCMTCAEGKVKVFFRACVWAWPFEAQSLF